MTDAPLTPAEAFVLLEPDKSSPAEAFKIAFLTFIAQGVIKISMAERRSKIRRREILVPVATVVRDPPATFLAADIVSVVRDAEAFKTGATLATIGSIAPVMYLKREMILPALVARGLAVPKTDTILGLPVRKRHAHTPRGLEEKRRIETLLARARCLPSLIETDPDEAKAVVLAAGPLLLLVPELKGIYRRLAAFDSAPADRPDSPDFGAFNGDDSGSSGDQPGMFDFANFDVGALDMDFGAFDASFDSSFDVSFDGGGGE
jgi:hypothetical protein